MMVVTYTVHDRAGVKGNDVTITLRSDSSPDERALVHRMSLYTAGFTAALPYYVAGSGITAQSALEDDAPDLALEAARRA